MHYQRFDPSGCDFPKPRVPMLAPFSRHTLGYGQANSKNPADDGHSVCHFSRARYALLEAYRQSGVGLEGGLMAPAYHCRTMLDPAICLGAKVILYRLNPDLSVDLSALVTALEKCQHPVKALLATHYFGFGQNLAQVKSLCDRYAIALIEDCSHVLFAGSDRIVPAAAGTALGKSGRFCVASPYKFFSCEDGGTLWATTAQGLLCHKQRRPKLFNEVKSWLRAAQHACAAPLLPDPSTLSDQINAWTSLPLPTGQDGPVHDEHASQHYVEADASLQSLAGSRWIMRHTNITRLVDRRRLHYQQWVNAMAGLPHCRTLFPELPHDVVPYAFPLYLEQPETHFYALKMLGVPVWRWDDLAVSTCPVATDFRLRLLHLPCHQELTAEQMLWMTSAVQLVMRQL
ncbi:DegT/DnrJ/EryC1/StrS family aminotransferase [Rhodoferax sp.]|uniref:DegT/DnrJ/EryC1/StrS family aminotransferase n=1 Tax=Rhodoferax sp. TaxID=50421 RepID=UPI0025EAD197|nr:DegT/DnrJ/EryC1/StrS family aminotransferase [Rhodoferax sp.]